MSTKRIQIIEHVTELLECFTEQKAHLNLAELQDMLDLPKSTLHRILISLVEQGILNYDADTRRYSFGLKILRWSSVIFNHLRIHNVARPYLTSLRDRSGETATLTLRIGLQRMYIDQIQSLNEIRMSVEVGKLFPLYPGANGKAILSFLAPKEIEQMTSKYFNPVDSAYVSLQELRKDLESIQRLGYSTSAGERVQGSISVSAPLFSDRGEVMGAVGLSGPAGRFSIKEAREWGPTLRDIAAEISSRTVWIYQDH